MVSWRQWPRSCHVAQSFGDTKPSGAYPSPRGMGNIHELKVWSIKPTNDLVDKNRGENTS